MVVQTSASENVILNSLIGVILIIATISNSLLLLVFHRRPGLRTISNRFVINLLITNLITCWILLPLLLLDNVWRKIAGGAEFAACNYVPICAIKEGIAIALCTATVLSVLMIGIDQYFAVIDPLRYHSLINATTSVIMMAVSWTISVLFGVLGSLSVNEKSTWLTCSSFEQFGGFDFLPNAYKMAFPVVFVVLVFVVPFVAVCWIYMSICSAAHENNQRTKRNGSASNCVAEQAPLDYTIVSTIHESVEFDPNDKKFANVELPRPLHHSSTKSSLKSTSSSIVNSLRHRISNASMFRYREETRAARISALVIVMALFCWLPFTLMILIHSPLLGKIMLPHFVKQLGILSLSSNAVVSPFIFAHRNRRIHRELCKLFRISKRRTSFYDNLNAVRRSKSMKKRPIYNNPELAKKNTDLLISLTGNEIECVPANKSPAFFQKAVSILSKVWSVTKIETGNQTALHLPEIALETDTSRSSFSSNASSGSNHRSTSAASISDIVEEI
ncbi:probable G-protein coupled receptor No18 [Planococcus citri]|uniref:probable G-protein coupled receptor No18 n=1 Tax=Planococcus citri TaxID=170843 RepID=UPI0031F91914